jgi:endonuclease/exonuclease/phosphatase family metal-dependent hydrolase
MPSEDRDESIDHIFVGGISPEKLKKFMTVTDKGALEASDHCPIIVEADI